MKIKDLKNIIAYMEIYDIDMDKMLNDRVADAKALGGLSDADIYERHTTNVGGGKNGMTLYEEWEERYRNYTNLINWIYNNKFEAIYGCDDMLRKEQ